MGFIVLFLTKLDAAIQRRFDSVCFWLMSRFGIRKLSVRYVLFAVSVMSLASLLISQSVIEHVTFGQWLFFITCCTMLLVRQYYALQDDVAAEQAPNSRSKADAKHGNLQKLMAVIMIVCMSLELLFPSFQLTDRDITAGPHRFPPLCGLCFSVSWLALTYLAKTPMNPPAEKEREPVGTLRPASAKT